MSWKVVFTTVLAPVKLVTQMIPSENWVREASILILSHALTHLLSNLTYFIYQGSDVTRGWASLQVWKTNFTCQSEVTPLGAASFNLPSNTLPHSFAPSFRARQQIPCFLTLKSWEPCVCVLDELCQSLSGKWAIWNKSLYIYSNKAAFSYIYYMCKINHLFVLSSNMLNIMTSLPRRLIWTFSASISLLRFQTVLMC